MNHLSSEQIEATYKARGLVTEAGFDKPGTVYKPHVHEQTYLYTVSGGLRIRLDGAEWKEVLPGTEIIVATGQLHEAVVGEDGWQYVAAWDEEEAKQFEH